MVALCRCYKSSKFPLCDGTHVKHNEETGDNVAPVVVKSGLPPEMRKKEFVAEISAEEMNKAAKGLRANNYGIKSNMPPENPSRRADMIDIEDVKVGGLFHGVSCPPSSMATKFHSNAER